MAEITGLTSTRMKEIEDDAIVRARIDSDELITVANDGTENNLGNVRGAKGDTGPMGEVTSAQLATSDATVQAAVTAVDDRVDTLDTTVTALQSTVTTQGTDISTAQSNISSNDTDITNLTNDINAQKADFVPGSNPQINGGYFQVNGNGVRVVSQNGDDYLRYPLIAVGRQSGVYSIPGTGSRFEPLNDTEIVVQGFVTTVDLHYQVDARCTFGSGLLAVALYKKINSGSWFEVTTAPEVIIQGDSATTFGGRCTTGSGRYIDEIGSGDTIRYKLYAKEINAEFDVNDHTQLSATVLVGYQGFIL